MMVSAAIARSTRTSPLAAVPPAATAAGPCTQLITKQNAKVLSPGPIHDAIERIDKNDWQYTTPAAYRVSREVAMQDERLVQSAARSVGWRYETSLCLLSKMMMWYAGRHFSQFQVAGLNRFRDPETTLFAFRGPLLWLGQHSDNPFDAVVLGALYNAFPRIAGFDGKPRAMVPHVIMKQIETWPERIATGWLFGRSVVHVNTRKCYVDNRPTWRRIVEKLPRSLLHCVSYKSLPNDPILDLAAEKQRKEHNTQVLQQAARDFPAHGGHMMLYPEGKVNGSGDIQIPASGALEAFCHTIHGQHIMTCPVAWWYTTLGRDKPAVLINIGRPLIVTQPIDSNNCDALRADVQLALVRQGVVSIESIVGAYLLWARDVQKAVRLQLNADSLTALCKRVAEAVLNAQAQARKGGTSALNEFIVDTSLCAAPNRVAAFCKRAWDDMRQRGYVDVSGVVNCDKLGARAAEPKLPRALHRSNPLLYYGLRTQQTMQFVPEYERVLQHAWTLTWSCTTSRVGSAAA